MIFLFNYNKTLSILPILDSIVVSIPACHAGGRGSIPRRGDILINSWVTFIDKFLVTFLTKLAKPIHFYQRNCNFSHQLIEIRNNAQISRNFHLNSVHHVVNNGCQILY